MHRDGMPSRALDEKKKRGVIPRAHLAEPRSRARPIFLQRPRLTYMPVFPMHAPDTPQCRTCCTPYHYSTLICTWPFVFYGDARPDTGNIRLFHGGGKNARGRPLYTCYEWSSFRRGQATWNLNYFFSQPTIIISFLSLRTWMQEYLYRVDSRREFISKTFRFSVTIIYYTFSNVCSKVLLPSNLWIILWKDLQHTCIHNNPRDLWGKVIFHRIRNPVVRDRKRKRDWQSPGLSAGLCIGYTAVVNSPVDRWLSLITRTITPANTIADTMYAPPNGRRNSFPRKFPAICETSRRASTSYQGRLYKAP